MALQIAVDLIDAISPLITMAFGIFGATRDTKPKDGKLTRDGKIALWGIILSACFTLLVKTGNLYFKNKAEQDQIIKAKLEEQKKQEFQGAVAKSFEKSISKLESINASVGTTLDEVHVVNKTTKRNIDLASKINAGTHQVLTNTQRVLDPLFPVDFLTVRCIHAPKLNDFWDFIGNKCSTDTPSVGLNESLFKDYQAKSAENAKKLLNTLQGSVNIELFKKDGQIGFYTYDSDSYIDFKNTAISCNSEEKAFYILTKKTFSRPDDIIPCKGQWKGVNDVKDISITTSGTNNRKDVQLIGFFLYHNDYGKAFLKAGLVDVALRLNATNTSKFSWQTEYSGSVGKQTTRRARNLEMALSMDESFPDIHITSFE